jgi:hypothetical protein
VSTAPLSIVTSRGTRPFVADDWLDASAADRAAADANQWIKSLRHARVDGQSLRDRFTHRGDSLWWFAELYLHKLQVVTRAFRAVAALERLAEAERGGRWLLSGSDPVVGCIARAVAERHGVAVDGPADAGRARRSARSRAKAAFHTASALADRLRPSPPLRLPSDVGVAAFVHAAFLRPDTADEAYTGHVLKALQAMAPGRLHLVGVGPRTNFRVRRWRDRLREFVGPAAEALRAREAPAPHIALTPVESLAGWASLAPARAVWRSRREVFDALSRSRDLRDAAVVSGYDVWPLVEEQLRGIADLQFPWSARAMDEAGAALDRLRPRVVLTYAEAGGWGRALILEARRRGIPSAALQHGFIYRHWLNYLHEPDEMAPSPANPRDAGFPRPDLTLIFDDFARDHLEQHGRFPPASLRVTGSPRLDAIAASAGRMDEGARRALRAGLGVPDDAPIVLVAAKFTQMGAAFGALVRAMRGLPEARLVVKPHPAEGAAPYLAAAGRAASIAVAPGDADLGALTALASVLVTVNSTAAIEAMALDVPALIVGLPNNLSPFVEAGAMAGAGTLDEIGPRLRSLLYDREMRRALGEARQAFMRQYGIRADGAAADRAAEAIISLART